MSRFEYYGLTASFLFYDYNADTNFQLKFITEQTIHYHYCYAKNYYYYYC